MTTDLTRSGSFDDAKIALIKRTIAKDATTDELALFVQVCERTGLDPFARQIYCIHRGGRMGIQTSIDGLRLIAERTKHYAGQLGPFWTADGKTWVDVWLEKSPPRAAKVGILRDDFKEPMWSVGTWDFYAQSSPMWSKGGAHMLAKCVEALGLRRAFPQELSGLYTEGEMDQAGAPEYTPPRPVAESPERIAGTHGEAPQDAGKAPTDVAAASVPFTSEPATSKPRTAAQVPATGGPITPDQIKIIHVLLGRAGNITDEAYRKQLAVYRQEDGSRCVDPTTGTGTSKLLSKDQASHFISRLEDKCARQEQRAAQGVDIQAAIPAAKTLPLEDLMQQRLEGDEDEAHWLKSLFNVEHRSELNKDQAETALQLLLVMNSSAYDDVETKARAMGKIR